MIESMFLNQAISGSLGSCLPDRVRFGSFLEFGGPEYRPPNTWALSIRTPRNGTPLYGNRHLGSRIQHSGHWGSWEGDCANELLRT